MNLPFKNPSAQIKFAILILFGSLILTTEAKGQVTPLLIKTANFTLVFPSWTMERNYYEIQQKGDSVFIYPELGETPEGMVFQITESVKIIKITQHYRTTISISEEGPHWDLFDWKHYISPKLNLKVNDGYFSILKYSGNERNRFPEYTEKELTDYVKKHTPAMLPLLYNNEKFSKDALYHSISEIFLTITYTKPDSEEILTQVIVFNLPLGC